MKQLLLCARVLELRKYNGPMVSHRATIYRSAEQKGGELMKLQLLLQIRTFFIRLVALLRFVKN